MLTSLFCLSFPDTIPADYSAQNMEQKQEEYWSKERKKAEWKGEYLRLCWGFDILTLPLER